MTAARSSGRGTERSHATAPETESEALDRELDRGGGCRRQPHRSVSLKPCSRHTPCLRRGGHLPCRTRPWRPRGHPRRWRPRCRRRATRCLRRGRSRPRCPGHRSLVAPGGRRTSSPASRERGSPCRGPSRGCRRSSGRPRRSTRRGRAMRRASDPAGRGQGAGPQRAQSRPRAAYASSSRHHAAEEGAGDPPTHSCRQARQWRLGHGTSRRLSSNEPHREEVSRTARADWERPAPTRGPSGTPNGPRPLIRMTTCPPRVRWRTTWRAVKLSPSPRTRPAITPR